MSQLTKYPKPQVGQVVWVETEQRRKSTVEEATVTKVGRKWVDISGRYKRRFNIETWALDGVNYLSHGQVYPCREEREKEVYRFRAWRNLSDAIDRYRVPPNVTIEAIHQVAELLGLEVKPS